MSVRSLRVSHERITLDIRRSSAGDFDGELEKLDPALVERLPPNPDAEVRMVVDLDGDDAARLSRIAISRGEDREKSSRACSAPPIAKPPTAPRPDLTIRLRKPADRVLRLGSQEAPSA